jgi:hypothetical protein
MPEITSAQAQAQLRRHHFARIHPLVTAERVADAVEREFTSLDNPGFCLVCGAEADGCEPDAEQYPCESCGEPAVYGAAEILIAIAGSCRPKTGPATCGPLFYWRMAAAAE